MNKREAAAAIAEIHEQDVAEVRHSFETPYKRPVRAGCR
jgi:hypothetical protein